MRAVPKDVQPAIFTVKDVVAHLSKYALADGLMVLNRLSGWVDVRGPETGMRGAVIEPGLTVTQWDIAFIAKQLILCSNDYRAKRLSEELDRRGLRHALWLVSNMRDPVLTGDRSATREQTLNSLIRFAYQQFRHQGWAQDGLFRTYLLYDRIGRSIPDCLDLSEAAREVYGASIVAVVSLGIVLFALAGAETFSSFRPSAVTNMPDPRLASLRRVLTPEVVRRLWPLVATDYAGFRELCAKHEVDPAYAKFEWNPLEARPVILTRYPSGVCVVPSLTALLLRFTDGPYYDFIEHYDAKGNQREFTSAFGKVFEQYVGQQLRAHYDPALVLPARRYKVGRMEWEGPDWIAIEGESALLIECRTSRLVLPGKVLANETAIAKSVDDKLLLVITHFPDKIKHIRGNPDLWPELAAVTRFYPVVVTCDPWWPAQPFHDVVDRALAGQSIPPYHIISVDTLERLLCFATRGAPIAEILQERIDRGQQGWAFGPELDERAQLLGTLPPNRLIEAAKVQLFEAVGMGEEIDSRSVRAT